MKFIVSRQKTRVGIDGKPCDEAHEERLTPLDYRMVGSLKEAEGKLWYQDWLEEGSGHREEDGMVVCERKEKIKRWVVEISTLEELIGFQQRYGTITIMDSTPYAETRKEITIKS